MKYSFFYLTILFFILGCGETSVTQNITKNNSTGDTLSSIKNHNKDLVKNHDQLNLSEIEQEIIENPESPNVYYKRAYYYKKRKKYSLALEDINRSIKLSPDASVLNYEKAAILYEYGVYNQDISKIDESKIYLNHTLSLNKENLEANLLKAKILLFEKDTDASMRLVNDVLKINKTIAEAYFIKGMIYDYLNNMDLAISSYQTAVEMNPNYYDAFIHLGLLFEKKGDDKAIRYYDWAIEIYPNSLEAYRNKGLFYHFHGYYIKARECFQKIIQLDSVFEEAYFNIGNTYIGAFRDDMDPYSRDTTLNNAIYYFQKAIDLNPFYVQAIYNLGLQYEYKGNTTKAKELYLKAIELDNNYSPALKAVNSI